MSRATKDLLHNIQERTDAQNMTEVVRKSLAVYDVVTKQQSEGGQIFVRDSSGAEVPIIIV